MSRRRNYAFVGIGLMLGMALMVACAPDQQRKQPQPWEYLDIHGGDKNAGEKTHKPFGCDSRDLATFTCD